MNANPLYVVTFDTPADGNSHCAEGTFERIGSARKLKSLLSSKSWTSNVRILIGGIGGMEVQ